MLERLWVSTKDVFTVCAFVVFFAIGIILMAIPVMIMLAIGTTYSAWYYLLVFPIMVIYFAIADWWLDR